ncbi:MAG: hypothetical protein JNM13_16100 [Hyphomicrobiaceae bacterium]|nr:hypothetical protein [Hyphomicrobiaceae bacterium]
MSTEAPEDTTKTAFMARPMGVVLRNAAVKTVLGVTRALVRLRMRPLARKALTAVSPHLKADRATMDLVTRVFHGHRSNARLTQLRLQRLNELMVRPLARKKFPRLLYLASRFEALEKNIPVKLGDMIARQMVSDQGRARIQRSAQEALKQAPHSPFLIYLYTVTMAKAGAYQEASTIVAQKIEQLTQKEFTEPEDIQAAKKRYDTLRNTWRVIDQIAREDTGWLDTESGNTYGDLVVKGKTGTEQAKAANWTINFKEPLLQGKQEGAYLDACLDEFRQSVSLIDRLRVINEMLRQGVRRQLTFHRAYQQANQSLDEVMADIRAAMEIADPSALPEKAAVLLVQTLTMAMDIMRSLRRPADIVDIKTHLVAIAQGGLAESAVWLILPALVSEDEETWTNQSVQLINRLPAAPDKENQLKAYLLWAMRARMFKDAEIVFKKLPTALQSSPAALYFVNILQRQSRFTEAIHVLKRVHAYMLSKPARVNPHQHWSVIRRYGELTFLRQTSNTFQKAKQPTNPKGVIVIAARNIDQLRKYPLVVLMELKRQGWAVIPLVEGLLPREMTENPRIDLLNGCITMELGLRPAARRAFKPLEDFVAEPSKGILTWKGLNLGHSMLEDARINRRTYDVDFSCPALTDYLQRLCDWTERIAQATVYAHSLFFGSKTRCGLLSLFNSRLPDSLFRFFCDEFGNKDTFFCLQTANGYENYFTNFSTKISTRCVIRNMTRDNAVRSASLPNPDVFDQYFEANKYRSEEVLKRVEAVMEAKKPAVVAAKPLPALECRERVMKWRAEGGKVACIFGKVVCDSAVPWDGGPVHQDLRDWLQDTIDAVRDSNTLLLIKPHPHELNEQIATYLNQYFTDLIDENLPPNVIILEHRWFNIDDMKEMIDLGLIYNGTTAIELALLGIPCILANHFAPSDYHVGHIVPKSREEYHAMLRFEIPPHSASDARARAGMWLEYMSNGRFTIDYRYHTRPITNKVIYPPYWINEDIENYIKRGDRNVRILAGRVTGALREPSF